MLMPCSAYTQQCTGESRRYGRPPATGPPPRAALPLLRWRGRCAPRHTLPPPGPEPRSPSRRAGAPHPAWPGTPATSRRCESRRSALPSSACPAAPPAPPYGQGGSVHSSGPSLQRASRPCQTTRTPRPLSVLFLAPFPLAPPPPPRAACIAPPPPRAACEPLETTPLFVASLYSRVPGLLPLLRLELLLLEAVPDGRLGLGTQLELLLPEERADRAPSSTTAASPAARYRRETWR